MNLSNKMRIKILIGLICLLLIGCTEKNIDSDNDKYNISQFIEEIKSQAELDGCLEGCIRTHLFFWEYLIKTNYSEFPKTPYLLGTTCFDICTKKLVLGNDLTCTERDKYGNCVVWGLTEYTKGYTYW